MGGVEIGICLVYFSIFAGVRVLGVCVLVYARTHTQTTWVLDVSPGVGMTPGEQSSSLCNEVETGGHGMMGWGPAASTLTDMPVRAQYARF